MDSRPSEAEYGPFEQKEVARSRDGAVSPSTISTASSAAPLMRADSTSNRSIAGNSRPKIASPASIAAAQLQCQHEQQLKKQATELDLNNPKKANGHNWLFKGSEGTNNTNLTHSDKGQEAAYGIDDGRGFAYNVGKSIAFKANR